MSIPSLVLNDGNEIPQLGYGLFQIADDNASTAVCEALQAGYRLLDTAKIYCNEKGVGEGIRQAFVGRSVTRQDLFVTTKLWNSDQGYDTTHKAFDESAKLLGLDVIDLYLVHWPVPSRNLYVESWKACIDLQKSGRVRSIGVCNFRISDLERILDVTGVAPVLNQIELHPGFQQRQLRDFHKKNHISTQAWSPLARGMNDILQDKKLAQIATRHQRTIAQIILRWHIEIGNIVIPKTQNSMRMQENASIFDFNLSEADHAVLATLDRTDGRIGPDPSVFE